MLGAARAQARFLWVWRGREGLWVEGSGEIGRRRKTAVKVRLHRARKRMLEDYRRWRGGR